MQLPLTCATTLPGRRADLPLKFAAEPSLRERASKWFRRHPKLVSPAALCVYLAAALLVASAVTVRMSLDARARRQDAERIKAYRHYEEFLTLADQVKLAAGSPEKASEVWQTGTEALHRYGATEPGWNRARMLCVYRPTIASG